LFCTVFSFSCKNGISHFLFQLLNPFHIAHFFLVANLELCAGSVFHEVSDSSHISTKDHLRFVIAVLRDPFHKLLLVAADFHEVCQWESFKARCPKNEVIMVEQARYGRMQLGRCIKENFGYLGCSTNVIAMADRKCSGRRQCEIDVYKTFGELRPCTELESSFSAIYSCIRGA